MDEFTPTTEQVENAYSYDPEYEYYHPDNPGYHHSNRAAFKRWLAEYTRAKQEEAYDLGVATALNHAKSNEDGITLSLVTFDGDPWPHPYRKQTQ